MSTENSHKSFLPDNAVIKEGKPVLFWRLVVFFSLTCLVSLCFSAVSSADEGKRSALIIGIDAYEEVPQLAKANNDATAMADALDTLGFDVHLHLDVTRRQLYRALTDFTATLGSNDESFVFFAGHGVESSGRNYLLPADMPKIRPGQEILLNSSSLPVDDIIQAIERRGARISTLVLDACRDNPFPREGTRSLGGTRGLTAVNVPKGTFILYSAGVGQAALDRLSEDDTDPNSVFTRVLLPRLVEPGLSVRDLAVQVRSEVESLAAMVGHQQRPAYYDEISGAFSFAPKPIVDELPTESESNQDGAEEQVGMSVCNSARADWPLVAETKSVRALDQFIDLYTECPVVTILAEERRDVLIAASTKESKSNENDSIVSAPEVDNAQKIESQPESRRTITIKTNPPDARVRVMNIAPVYQDGMKLKPGRYDIEVSALGYATHRQWYEMDNSDLVLDVQLSAVAVAETLGGGEVSVDESSEAEPSINDSKIKAPVESEASEQTPLFLTARQSTELWDGLGPEQYRDVIQVIPGQAKVRYIDHGFRSGFGMWIRVQTSNKRDGYVLAFQLIDFKIASFDGQWSGIMDCSRPKGGGWPAFRKPANLIVNDGDVELWGDLAVSSQPQTGRVSLSDGFLFKRGRVSISGAGRHVDGNRAEYRYSGKFENGSLVLRGNRGSRRCTITAHKNFFRSVNQLLQDESDEFLSMLKETSN